MQKANDRPIEVFYSYSRKDEEYRKKLGEHLYVLRRAGLITDWHDREIDAGSAWQEEIDRHLLSADIVLLLVSASFIASDYCWGEEMAKALGRHKEKKARVIQVILRPCGWLKTPLKVLQGIPRDNRAISLWANEHAAFDDLVTEIAKVVDDLRRSKTTEPELVEQTSAVAVVASMEAAPSAPHPDHLPQAGEGDQAEAAEPLIRLWEKRTQLHPRPPAGEGGTRDSGRVRGRVRAVPKDGVYIRVDPRDLPDFAVFRDVDALWCREMVALPAGSFLIGSPPDEKGHRDNEGPQHRVTINQRFTIGRYAVTFAEYDHFCEGTNRKEAGDSGWGRGIRPVINVSWRDAQAYVEWLSRETGQVYRLPSEAEWEYACRAGTTTRYSWGDEISENNAKYGGWFSGTMEVGAYPADPWGLYEMHGNALEWVEDVWHDSYNGAPTDGSAWAEGGGSSASAAAVPGAAVRGTSVRRSATGAGPASAAAFSGSVLPGHLIKTLA